MTMSNSDARKRLNERANRDTLDLAAIEALAEAATPGPWQFLKDYAAIYGPEPIEAVKAAARDRHEVAGPVVIAIMEDNGPLAEVDAAFIAAARTAVPALVARVRETEAMHEASKASARDFWRRVEKAERECADLRAKLEAAELDRDLLAQAMWDGWATLGFDTDGDQGPGAWIAGAKSYAIWAEGWLRDIREHRKDDDEGMDEYAALCQEARNE